MRMLPVLKPPRSRWKNSTRKYSKVYKRIDIDIDILLPHHSKNSMFGEVTKEELYKSIGSAFITFYPLRLFRRTYALYHKMCLNTRIKQAKENEHFSITDFLIVLFHKPYRLYYV